MLKREIGKLVLLELLFGLALVIVVVGFAVSGGADPVRFAIGMAVVLVGLVSCQVIRRRRRAARKQSGGASSLDGAP